MAACVATPLEPSFMKPSLLDKLEQMQRRAGELDALLADPDCTADMEYGIASRLTCQGDYS